MGLTARTFWLIFPPLHWVLGFIHVLLALIVITLQVIHLARHWKWLTAMAGKVMGTAG
jgi:membrane protein YdbS with pleckstrin-like domain